MSEINTGGRAFPWCGDLNDMPSINLGLTVRDYMAAKAMQGMLAYPGCESRGSHHNNNTPDGVAERAYEYADAMLRARGIA